MGSSYFEEPGTDEPVGGCPAGLPTILIVEDDAATRDVLLDLVTALGYRAQAVEDGPSGVEALGRSTFRLALVDINLPGFSGIELSRRIRERERARGLLRGIPIIAMTGSVVVDQRERCLDAGMDEMLLKPCPLTELEQTLRRWIGPSVGGLFPPDIPPVHDHVADQAQDDEDADVLDPRALSELRAVEEMTGKPLLRRAIESYLKTAPATLAAIRQGLAAADHEGVRVAAHSLKSPSAQLGARRLSKACAELEALARSRTLAGAGEVRAAIEREFERARRLLEREAS